MGARIYLAARFSRRHECNALGHALKARGATITSRWTLPDTDHVVPVGASRQAADSERQRFALEDMDDVRAANWTISLMEEPRSGTRGGRHIEFGVALALGQRLTIIGPRETVFHHLPHVEQFDSVDAFLASLPDDLPDTFATPAPAETGEVRPLDTAPKDGTYFLIVGSNFDGGAAVVHWNDDLEWWTLDDGKNFEIMLRHEQKLTGWLPLPALRTRPQDSTEAGRFEPPLRDAEL